MRAPRWTGDLAGSQRVALAGEVLAVLAAPAVLYLVLRLRAMAPQLTPDPSIHTTFIVDPGAIIKRYEAVFAPSARLREAFRAGFLVPARLSYLVFGAVPGFFVLRYALALIAIGPVYLLFRRLYGRWAGFAAIAVTMSSPVLITAWGADYPDSATISYLIGALALLALSWQSERPGRLIALSAGLLALAVWSLGVAVPVGAATVVAYVAVRLARRRERLGADLALAAGSALAITGLLALASKALIGQLDFITPTIHSANVLSQSVYVRRFHSTSGAWAPYDPYLLVPPAVILAFAAVFARRLRDVSSAVLFVGLAAALQLAVLAYLQFLGSEEFLEQYHFSSTLWPAVTLLMALIAAELLGPLVPPASAGGARSVRAAVRAGTQALPAGLAIGVALIYVITGPWKLDMTWGHGGAALAYTLVAAAVAGRLARGWRRSARSPAARLLRAVGLAAAVLVVFGSALLLTVAAGSPHAPLPGTVQSTAPEPPPDYASALGGDATPYIEEYSVESRLPAFVGAPAYGGEQLLLWWPAGQVEALLGPLGMYYGGFNIVSPSFPVLGSYGTDKIAARRAAQILILSLTGNGFDQAVRGLARFDPAVIRRAVLTDGGYHLHVWLVGLRRYLPPAARHGGSA